MSPQNGVSSTCQRGIVAKERLDTTTPDQVEEIRQEMTNNHVLILAALTGPEWLLLKSGRCSRIRFP